MIRGIGLVLAAASVLLAGGEAAGQYGVRFPQGAGGYGWGGWGSTPNPGLVRGVAPFGTGRPLTYNAMPGLINIIEANTGANWNNSLYRSNQASRPEYRAHARSEAAGTSKGRAAVQDRLRHHPNDLDITDGDALNVALDILLGPGNADRSIGQIKTPLKHDLILDIPFELASEGLTACLDRMTNDGEWPLALRGEAFRSGRDEVRKAVLAALEEDKRGRIETASIEAVRAAVDRFQAAFKAANPAKVPEFYRARDELRAMAGLAKMLGSPEMDKVLAELEDYRGTTLGDLLGFMHGFNLRFAPAVSYRQKQIYRQLQPMLAEQAEAPGLAEAATAAAAEKSGEDAATRLRSAAVDLFKGGKD